MGFKFEKLSVLVVDDTAPIRELVHSVLTVLGVGTIYLAKNGEEGFDLFCKKTPDIILTDWFMGPVDGIKMIDMIRNNANSPNKTVPIIMMTGYSAAHRVQEARDTGATEFLVKPFSADDIAKRIAYVINRPRDFIDASAFFGPDRRRNRSKDEYSGPKRRQKDREPA